MEDLDRFREVLLARRDELRRLLAGAGEDVRPVELDQQKMGRLSRMDAMQQQEMAREGERRRRAELVRIGHALDRIGSGDFGYCTSCGEPIAPRRLELDPATALCINCASA